MKSLEELKEIREKMQSQLGLRQESDTATRVAVKMGTCGIAAGARTVLTTIADEVQAKGLSDIMVVAEGCIGLCKYEPIVEVRENGKDKVTYVKVTPEKAKEIVEKHLAGGEIVRDYVME